MREKFNCYVMLATNTINEQRTPVESKMQRAFLQGEFFQAD